MAVRTVNLWARGRFDPEDFGQRTLYLYCEEEQKEYDGEATRLELEFSTQERPGWAVFYAAQWAFDPFPTEVFPILYPAPEENRSTPVWVRLKGAEETHDRVAALRIAIDNGTAVRRY